MWEVNYNGRSRSFNRGLLLHSGQELEAQCRHAHHGHQRCAALRVDRRKCLTRFDVSGTAFQQFEVRIDTDNPMCKQGVPPVCVRLVRGCAIVEIGCPAAARLPGCPDLRSVPCCLRFSDLLLLRCLLLVSPLLCLSFSLVVVVFSLDVFVEQHIHPEQTPRTICF